MPKKKLQRVSYEDALLMLDKHTQKFKSKLMPAYTFVEDYAGGSECFLNEEMVKQFLKKICR